MDPEYLIDDSEFLIPLYESVQKFDPGQRRDDRGRWMDQATVTLGDRSITVVKPERAIRAGDKLVPINVNAFDTEFQREPGFYLGVGGEGGIGNRYQRFGDYIAAHDSIEAPEVSVNKAGRVGFTNGRHRYAWLRDQGLTEIPMSMTPESVRNAKQHGLLAAVKRAWDESQHPRDDAGKFTEGGYTPDHDAPKEGEWDRTGVDPHAMVGPGPRWRQQHRQLVADAIASWLGDPSTFRIHAKDALEGAPVPGSGSGKQMRAQAEALLWEIDHHGISAPTLYRGSGARGDKGGTLYSWTESERVAKAFAKRYGGAVQVLPAGAKGLRVKDYTGDAFGEKHWLVRAGNDPVQKWEESEHPRDDKGQFTGTGFHTSPYEFSDFSFDKFGQSGFQGLSGLKKAVFLTTRKDFGYGPIRYPVQFDVKNPLHVDAKTAQGRPYEVAREQLTPEHDAIAIHWGDGSTEWIVFDPKKVRITGPKEYAEKWDESEHPRDEGGKFAESPNLAALREGLQHTNDYGNTKFILPDGTRLTHNENTHADATGNLNVALEDAMADGMLRFTQNGSEVAAPITQAQAQHLVDARISSGQEAIHLDLFIGNKFFTKAFSDRVPARGIRHWVQAQFDAHQRKVAWEEAKHPRDKEGQFTRGWHLTADPNFTPDPTARPQLNSLAGDLITDPPAGLFVGDPEYWMHAHGYERPYVAEIEGVVTNPPGTVMHKGHEEFMQGPMRTVRVLTLDEYAREVYREQGWVESHFDETPYHLRKKFPKGYVGRPVSEMTPKEIADWEKKFGEYFGRSDGPHPGETLITKKDPVSGRYVTPFVSFDKQGDDALRMIASLNSSRLATWGFTAEAEVRGMARYRLTAVLDGRTSKFCRLIDGKVFNVPDARKKVIEALEVQDPADLATVQPWPKQTKQALAEYAAMDAEELTERGLHIPPYHPYCRTVCRAVQSSAGETSEVVPTLPAEAEAFHLTTAEDLKELGIDATPEQVDQWNAHVGMSPVELLSKFSGLPPQEVMTKGQGVGSEPIRFDEEGVGFNVRGASPQGLEFKLGALLDPFTGIYYLTRAELEAGSPTAELAFMKQMLSGLLDMGLKSTATEIAVGVAGNAAYYARLGFLPDEVEWDSLRTQALKVAKPMLDSLQPGDRLLVEHLLQDKSVEALSTLMELPFTYEGKRVGEWLFGDAVGTWSLDLTDDLLVAQARGYLV